jgi:hypothetical protein
MAIGTVTTPLPLEAPDASRVKAPVNAEPVREAVVQESDSLDAELDNPYDNLACTD